MTIKKEIEAFYSDEDDFANILLSILSTNIDYKNYLNDIVEKIANKENFNKDE